MSTATIERPSPVVSDLSANVERLSRSYDPPIRGPILLASAGRGATNATFYIASALAERLGTDVEVAGVLEPYPALLFADQAPVYPSDFDSIRRDVIAHAIARRVYAIGPKAEQWPVTILDGHAPSAIAKFAREHDASMIVVGLGNHAPADRLPGGERALHILRSADRPVYAVAPDVVALPKTAVCGIDFSAASVRAARAALMSLAENGLLVLVNVRPLIDLLPLYASSEHSRERYEMQLATWEAGTERETAAQFARLREELRRYTPRGVTIETRTRSGVVLEELLAVANATGAQLVAVGTHGPGAIERFFIGSVATEVLRHARRSVLVAPDPSPAESARLSLRIRGTASIVDADQWGAVLEKFSARNAGRMVKLEVNDPELGAQLQLTGFALLGVTYDHHDQRVDVMLGDARDNTRHLTRSISRVDDVSIATATDGPEQALRILSGRSQTLVTFLDGGAS